MTLNGVDIGRLSDRKRLLASFDGFRREADASGMMEGCDSLNRQAIEILTSNRLVEALDLSKEDPAIRERYGKGDPNNYGDGAPRNLEQFLMARRLVEAGARVVTLNFGRWDFHSQNFSECKNTHFPMFDRGIHALVTDLHERGMDQDVAVVAWGEFGRTPRINPDAGRDHWPDCYSVLLAGGGDIDPARYGQDPDPSVYDVDAVQDDADFGIAAAALELGLPMLAVCRGLHVLNVLRGGTLVQDMPVNHRHHVHRVALEDPADHLGVGAASITCSCYHHQAIDRIGDGIVVLGRSEDGFVEAVQLPSTGWAAGVQWHPEDTYAADPAQLLPFRRLVQEAGASR